MANHNNDKSLEQWLWDAACSIRGAKDAPKYKDYILPLVFTKRLCDVFDDEINRIAKEVGGRAKAFKLVEADWRKATASKTTPMVRFYIPLKPANLEEPVWSVIRKLADKIGEQLTDHLRAIARENPKLGGII
ncbi:MAG: type I restriction-modification system subunit M N-terminal domain-containing protein, partial [Chloroflexota bacterium]